MAKADKKSITKKASKKKTKKSTPSAKSAPKSESSPQVAEKKEAKAKPKVEPWQLICPRNNWRSPIPYSRSSNTLLIEIASRLDLVHTVDPENQKMYLDLPVKDLPKPAGKRAGKNGWLTENFHLSEFHCKDGTRVPTWGVPRFQKLCESVLEPIRNSPLLEGGKIVVTSGYRHRAYNASIGGAQFSQHIECTAADIYCPELEQKYGSRRMVQILVQVARSTKATGIGTSYDNFVHVDIRPGSRVEW